MGWNRSNPEKEAKRSAGGQRNVRLRGFFAGVFVVIGATIAVWVIWPTQEHDEVGVSTKQELIKEVKPAVVKSQVAVRSQTNLPEHVAEKLSLADQYGHPQLITDDNGTMWYRGAKVPTARPGEARRNGKPWGHRSYFKKGTDNFLAATFLYGRTGGPMSAAPLNDKFYAALEKSLSQPVVIEKDDSPDVVEIKEQMQDLKKLLAEKIASGETMKDIIENTRKDQQKISEARKNYEGIYREMINDGKSSLQDVEDLVNAANSILKQYNAIPLRIPPGVRSRLQRQDQERKISK